MKLQLKTNLNFKVNRCVVYLKFLQKPFCDEHVCIVKKIVF